MSTQYAQMQSSLPGTRGKLRREREQLAESEAVSHGFPQRKERKFEVSAGNKNFHSCFRLIPLLACLLEFDKSFKYILH